MLRLLYLNSDTFKFKYIIIIFKKKFEEEKWVNKKTICIFIVLILILTIKPINLVANEVRMETIYGDTAWIGNMEILLDDHGDLIICYDNMHDGSARWTQSGFDIVGYVGVNITFVKGDPTRLIKTSILGGQLWLNYVKKPLPYKMGPGVIFVILKNDDHQFSHGVIKFSIPTSILSNNEINNKEFELTAVVKAFATLGIRIFRPKWATQTDEVTINISYD